jgi:hypothetical protein
LKILEIFTFFILTYEILTIIVSCTKVFAGFYSDLGCFELKVENSI